MKPGPWTKYNCASIEVGNIRVAHDGKRIRIRCADGRFDPPIEMDLYDFQGVMAAAMAIGVKPHGEPVVEREDLTCVGGDHITLTRTNESRVVMRITSDGIYVADGVSVDEAAQAVLDALSGEIQRLVSVARADDVEEIERLRRQLAIMTAAYADAVEQHNKTLDEQSDCSTCAGREVGSVAVQLATVTAERDELVTLLEEAVQDISDWGAYASEYFQDKWDLNGCIEKYKAALAKVGTDKGERLERKDDHGHR